ncbi:MAG: aminoacyl-tRNA hydrolase [Apilactobacillus sp.]|uniref:Peptidyl-tRNA hydrolase n=1 Tax=Apilactobacillus apinorum TaxID=1218495 RepID=A0ABP9ZI27_9LACO|nr:MULTISPECIES: aminoacyl-tRNA hydrolase [Apilactobacillus]KOY69577.1 Peptidyl-tRNA hydrolase [Apilactobacillus apinorum]MCT6822846.1 aminoacyl-tRNA hydrolase [Apilactobacillus sp.]MCT6858537.1 aminoacyl-tRNA hydrolase [Apilactobacillus sp.]CAI2631744.1 pth Peptidyl-tRNA hydrolase [Apilactobacillus apinorum]
MKMIVGLGNVGPQYKETRHNTGFMAIDAFAEKHGVELNTQKMEAKIGTTTINGEKVMLVEPLTFMNESGRSVGPLMKYFKLDLSDLIVIYDDMDLPVGKIRLRTHGSAGGHNGIKSLIAHLQTDKFNRIKVGTDHPTNESVVNYVLGQFTKDQRIDLDPALDRTVDAIEEFIDGVDFNKLENKYN